MSKISLRWRIAILMGLLVFAASALLTVLSIHNAADRFVIPIAISSSGQDGNGNSILQESNGISLDKLPEQLPGNVSYTPEVNLNIEKAQKDFSLSSFLYMIFIAGGSMVAAYYLAGKAMYPISKLSRKIEQIDGNSLSKRVPVPQTNDELETLSISFNKLLERLEQEFEREKRFSANVAHELKTPLATMIASAQVLQLSEQPTLEEYKENFDITFQSARRLSDVVEGFLLLYRTDREISVGTVNLSQLFSEIQKELEPLYIEKDIKLQFHLEENELIGNRFLLFRAFFNLVENAYKYSRDHGTITVDSLTEKDGIVVRVSDNGIGISVADQAHIFEPFYRADKSRSRKVSGAGLGLSITKEILMLHNASISIESQLNIGTAIAVFF